MCLLMISDDDQTTTRDRTAEHRALGFSTRLLGPVQITTDTMLGVTKRFFLPTIFPHRLADCATRGINGLKGIPYFVRHAYAGVAVDADAQL